MKILQAFEFMSLPKGGGTVDAVHKLASGLNKRGHEVTICFSDYEYDEDYLETLPVEIKLKCYHSIAKIFGTCVMPSVWGLDVSQYDIIHLHCYRSFQNIALCHKAILKEVPYVIEAHGSARTDGQISHKLFDMLFKNDMLGKAGYLIAETQVGVGEYMNLGVHSSRVSVIPLPIDVMEYNKLPPKGTFKAISFLGDRRLILFLGRLHGSKGIAHLVRAFKKLLSDYNDLHLVIAGEDDGYTDTIKTELEKLDLQDNYLFANYVSGRKKLRLLVDAEVLVRASAYEQGAKTPYEAAMCGTPTIVSKGTGAGEELSNIDGGYLVDYGNVEQLYQTMKHILENKSDVLEKVKNAQNYIKNNLTVDKQVEKYEGIYQECL